MNAPLNLAKLIAVCNGITGRKKLQKIVHLLQIGGFRKDFPYSFGYLHFGPFSGGVRTDLDVLQREELIAEKPTAAGDHATFRYVPTEKLDHGFESVGMASAPSWTALAQHLNAHTPQRLEAASTIAFLAERGFAGENLRSRFVELKPLLRHDFDEAESLYQQTARGSKTTRAADSVSG
jgi:uncharacterized protein